MPRTSKLVLLLFIVISVLVIGALLSEFVSVGYLKFAAGTRPTLEKTADAEPILPPLRDTDPLRGSQDKNAVVIIQFADFINPSTKLLEPELQRALRESPVPVRLIWRDAPRVADGPLSTLASLAGRCALEQGRFWAMHDALLTTIVVDTASVSALASTVIPNVEKFNTCVKRGAYLDEVQSDGALAEKQRIINTPVLFIGNKILTGTPSSSEIISAIQRATLK
ncbi:MAG: thioredoxin domain-containing protein [bacterium]|nr:thioredoxin domain-containing protein [bacterium]